MIAKSLLIMVSVRFIGKTPCNSHSQTGFTPLSTSFHQPCISNETLLIGFCLLAMTSKQQTNQTKY